MKKQLLDIALPSPPRAGLNIKQTFKGVLTDNETRERWISRFSYWWVHPLCASELGRLSSQFTFVATLLCRGSG